MRRSCRAASVVVIDDVVAGGRDVGERPGTWFSWAVVAWVGARARACCSARRRAMFSRPCASRSQPADAHDHVRCDALCDLHDRDEAHRRGLRPWRSRRQRRRREPLGAEGDVRKRVVAWCPDGAGRLRVAHVRCFRSWVAATTTHTPQRSCARDCRPHLAVGSMPGAYRRFSIRIARGRESRRGGLRRTVP